MSLVILCQLAEQGWVSKMVVKTAASCQLVRRRIISRVPFMEEVTDRLCLRKRSTRGTEVTVY